MEYRNYFIFFKTFGDDSLVFDLNKIVSLHESAERYLFISVEMIHTCLVDNDKLTKGC